MPPFGGLPDATRSAGGVFIHLKEETVDKPALEGSLQGIEVVIPVILLESEGSKIG